MDKVIGQLHADKCLSTQMVSFKITGDALRERMNRAVEKVQKRLEKTAQTLQAVGIPYAIIGGMRLRDMLDVELIDESWLDDLPPELATRLKHLIDNPE